MLSDPLLQELADAIARLRDRDGRPLYTSAEASKIALNLNIGGRCYLDRLNHERQEPVDGRVVLADGGWHRARKTWADNNLPVLFTFCRRAIETYMVDKVQASKAEICEECQALWKKTGKPDPV